MNVYTGVKFANFVLLTIEIAAWKYIKLLEVTVSPDAKNGYAPGHIKLVENRSQFHQHFMQAFWYKNILHSFSLITV